eukprot:CAMPEP_0202339348 /NCGR_PEP_ID=MMETSP1126-20121109/1250_1 /ASSEMBLY_ACC=CAM_ASM_000457 /TAXON_ID=3047 /ORGANISM="Dunaliella tertiolecta, Strain CCMP1320" /LENGTH=1084 /DNA_ID=CAMNT_0048929889 /DNA_START=100 /DNA_END=3354 /DNA_ORIENTATION=-
MDASALPALTPADINAVLQCLTTALSPAQGANKHAEAVLASLEQRPGFCSCLAEIIGGRAAHDYSARWLASVHLKNTVVRHWRSKAERSGLSPQERAHLRAVMLGLIDQEDNQIAIQVALTVAKMARADFPQDWPNLFHDLLAQLSHEAQQQQHQSLAKTRRVYLVLHNLLKELSSKRLPSDQRSFHEVSVLLLPFLWTQWGTTTQVLLAGLPEALAESPAHPPPSPQSPAQQQQQQGGHDDSPLPPPRPAPAAGLLPSMECWILLLKCLRRVLLLGFGSDAKLTGKPTQQVAACLPTMVEALQLSGALLPLLHFFCQLVISHGEHGVGTGVAANSRDRLLIQAMTYIHNVLTCQPYQRPSPPLPDPNPDQPGGGEAYMAAQAHAAMIADVQHGLQATWSPERLQGLCMALVGGYMKLTRRDLQDWETDSEEFYHAHDTSGWQDHPKLCAENLYLTLLKEHQGILAPLVVHLLQQACAACPLHPSAQQQHPPSASSDASAAAAFSPAMAAKEAVMNAVAVGAYELHDAIPFPTWLRTSLLPEILQGGAAALPLRRCAARVVAQWAENLETPDRPAVYSALMQIMAEPDACMKLTAATSLTALIGDWNFSEAQFSEFVGPLLHLVTSALPELHEMDSHTHMFHLMNLVVERMGEGIKPHVPPLLQVLPQQWVSAEGQSHVRIQIISMLQRLINVLGVECTSAYPILSALLPYVLDPSQREAAMLLEDGLGLWLVALRNAPPPLPPFLLQALFPHFVQLMMRSTEHMHVGTALLTSCVLAGGQEFLGACGNEVAALMCSLVGNVSARGLLLLLPPLGLTLIVSQGGSPVGSLTPALQQLLSLVVEGGSEGDELSVACSLSVFARLLLHAPQAFTGLLASAALSPAAVQAAVQPVQAAASAASSAAVPLPPPLVGAEANLGALCTAWCERFDAIAHPAHRRLNALALCALLALPAAAPLWWLDAILGCVTGVVASTTPDNPEGGGAAVAGYDVVPELARGNGPDPDADGAFVDLPLATSEDAEAESLRRQQLLASDPAARMGVVEALRQGLGAAEALHGPVFHASMARLDPTLQQQVAAALGGRSLG